MQRSPWLINTTDIIPYTGQVQDDESEDEGDVYDNDNSASMLSKGCGLLPNLHIRNSLSLLNHVAEVGKTNKSSHIRSFSPVPAVKKVKTMHHSILFLLISIFINEHVITGMTVMNYSE